MELNEKLARWAGLQIRLATDEHYHWFDGDDICSSVVLEDGVEYIPFTDSLDACFKWLVPKLRQVTMSNSIVHPEGWMVDIFAGGGVGKLLDRSSGAAKTPSLALCLATEQLIDSEVRHE